MHISFFPDFAARSLRTADLDLQAIATLARNTTAAEKSALPWLKLARFGDATTQSGSLRNNANVLSVTGVEGDYDGEIIEPEEAAGLLQAAGISALIHTSPSHHPMLPRWRVLCPLSEPMPAGMRAELVGRVNHVLGGVLASESFTLSQSYLVGAVEGGQPVETYITNGRPIDTVEMPSRYPVHKAAVAPITLPPMRQGQSADEHIALVVAEIHDLFSRRGDIGRHEVVLSATLTLAPFVLSGHMSREDAEQHVADAMVADGREPNPGEVERALDGGLDRAQPFFPPTNGEEFGAAPPPPRHKLFTSRDFRLDNHRG